MKCQESESFLEVSHCKMTFSLFKQIPVQCPVLIFFLLHDFKTYVYPKILNVAGNRETLLQTCLIKHLQSNNTIIV